MAQPSELSPELQKLCERASQEQDPEKLRELTELINSLLDEKFAGGGKDTPFHDGKDVA
jgi:hypothetical protein